MLVMMSRRIGDMTSAFRSIWCPQLCDTGPFSGGDPIPTPAPEDDDLRRNVNG